MQCVCARVPFRYRRYRLTKQDGKRKQNRTRFTKLLSTIQTPPTNRMSDFTPELLAEWKSINEMYVRGKGKPTPEQIEQQKKQTVVRDAFLAKLGAKSKGEKKKKGKALDDALKGPKKVRLTCSFSRSPAPIAVLHSDAVQVPTLVSFFSNAFALPTCRHKGPRR